LEWRYFKSL